MTEATCAGCGEPNAADAEFCIGCGGYLGWQDRRPGDPTTRPPATTTTTTVATTPAAPVDRTAPATETGPRCASCGTPNPADLRFCRKCGTPLTHRADPTMQPAAPARPGWRRFLPGNASRRRARAAYRRSLPMRYHLTRLVAVVAVVAVLGGLFTLAGHNPAGWLRDRWYALRGTLTPVTEVTARADPARTVIDDYLPGFAVDNTTDQAWATTWGGGGSPATACGPITRGARAALILTLPQKTTLRGVEVAAGLPAADPQRVLQWRPRMLQLTFDDDSCQRVALADKDGLQRGSLRPVPTTTVRVEIAAAAPPRSGAGTRVALGEVRLLRRPG